MKLRPYRPKSILSPKDRRVLELLSRGVCYRAAIAYELGDEKGVSYSNIASLIQEGYVVEEETTVPGARRLRLTAAGKCELGVLEAHSFASSAQSEPLNVLSKEELREAKLLAHPRRAEAVELYCDNEWGVKRIAKHLHMGDEYVTLMLKLSGVKIRKAGEPKRKGKTPQ